MLNLQNRQIGNLLDRQIDATGDGPQHFRQFLRLAEQNFKIVAEQLQRNVGFHAREHLVDPLLNRLSEPDGLAGNIADLVDINSTN